jgi:(1->4)-alpha-D-glucan 1-alpha-D-glucosylmutase
VDFALRSKILGQIDQRLGTPGALARDLLEHWQDGAVKLYVTHIALATRAQLPEVFLRGDYEPIAGNDHVVAFSRSTARQRVLVLVPRLTVKLGGGPATWPLGEVWKDATIDLPQGAYHNVFTGARHQVTGPFPLAAVFATFPLALLVHD